MKGNVFKQKYIGKYWGKIALAGSQLGVFIAFLTLLTATVSAFPIVSGWLDSIGIHMQFWMFVGLIVLVVIILYVLSWVYLVASFYSSSTEQFWIHNNPLKGEVDILKTEIGSLKDIIKTLNDNNAELNQNIAKILEAVNNK